MSYLFFVPARGGSKRIKNKNLIKINNKPLIKYTLDICKKFKNIKTVISTDNKSIKYYCVKKGFSNIHDRPKNFSKDSTSMIDVLLDYLNNLPKEKIKDFKYIILLQPTSPLRTYFNVKKCLNIFKKKKLNSLASVSIMREHPYECVEIKKDKWDYLSEPKKKILVSQKYKCNFFFIDGSIYINSVNFIKKYKSLIVKGKTKFIKNSNDYAIDINYPEDLIFAKYKMKKK
jgi:CMP-N-acetylneuraminic acid synthetase